MLILAMIFVVAGTAPPDVNEAHYLPKAKRYWNPDWCGADIFLDSADAHPVFYTLSGWPTLWLSLPAVAWLGRFAVWSLVAWGWQRLSWSIAPRPYVSVLSAAWLLMLNQYGHLAGEWAVGGFEAKSLAYALVLMGARALVLRHWPWVWVWFGGACALHVLVGGWSLVAAAVVWLLSGPERPSWRTMWLGLLIGAGLALAGLAPALRLSAGVDAGAMTRASLIYVFGRLPHHLVFHTFAPQRVAMFGLVVLFWGVVWWGARRSGRWRMVHRFAWGAVGISLVGVALDYVLRENPATAAKILRLYWYRLADVAVPMAVALGLPRAIPQWARGRQPWLGHGLWVAAVLVPLCILGGAFVGQQRDGRPGAIAQSDSFGRGNGLQRAARYSAWREVCAWIVRQTDPHARFLTPRNQQTFRWYAERADVVCWKDIPQDPGSIVQWWSLLQELYPPAVLVDGLGAWSDDQLRAIAQEQSIDYILVDRAYTSRRLGLERVYPESPRETAWFELYRVNAR